MTAIRDNQLWDSEYARAGIPSSTRERPSNVVVEFLKDLRRADHRQPTALDIGCGQGRNSIYLADQGFLVTAIDYSKRAIAALNQVIESQSLPVTAILQDVTKPWTISSSSQDLAIDTFCFKHVISDEGIHTYISELSRVLRPGARFLLFLATKQDGYYRKFAVPNQSGRGTIILDPGNGIRSRLYDPSELQLLFRGFTVERSYMKQGRNDMHGAVYERESLALHLVRS